MDINFIVKPKKLSLMFFGVVMVLTLANTMVQILKLHFGYEYAKGFIPLFGFNGEGNIPAIYSALAILFCVVLLALIALVKKGNGDRYASHWKWLSYIFLFLSFDEAFEIHEILSIPVQTLLNTSGIFYFAWVIPYGLLLAVFILMYLKFLLNLPRSTRRLFIIAGVVFVSGAVGLEMVGSRAFYLHGMIDASHALWYSIEEPLEMLGIVIFIYALTSYIDSEIKEAVVRFRIISGTVADTDSDLKKKEEGKR